MNDLFYNFNTEQVKKIKFIFTIPIRRKANIHSTWDNLIYFQRDELKIYFLPIKPTNLE